MKFCKFFALTALALCSLTTSVTANLLVNSSFEDPVVPFSSPSFGIWQSFNGGAGSSAANSTLQPRTGTQSLRLEIAGVNNTFAGAFQDVPIVAGMPYELTGWNMADSLPLGLQPEVRIEWRTADNTSEISRTPNMIPAVASSYGSFSLNAIAPAGAGIARVVYAVQTFTPEPSNSGIIFVDDLSLVPEPSSMVLLGTGVVALAGIYRKRFTTRGNR